MGKGKPRTATHRKVNKRLESMGPECEWWDGSYSECDLPWCGKEKNECQGNPFVCKKLLYRYLARSKKISKIVRYYLEWTNRKDKNMKPITEN